MFNQKNMFPRSVRRLVLGWLMAAALEMLLLPGELRDLNTLDGVGQMSLVRMPLVTMLSAVLLSAFSHSRSTVRWERWGIAAVFGVLALICLWTSFTWTFFAACFLVFAAAVLYGVRGWNKSILTIEQSINVHKAFCWITAIATVTFFLFVSVWGVCRVYSFSTPSFDFGIFAQMFHSMKTTGIPMTTLERDGLLSHFAVHVSPVYYLMLPVYWLAPIPATLQVLQAAVLASAVFPLWKLSKHHGFDGWGRMLCCVLLLLYPAYAGGTSYDLHENCFLTPLILWLLYGLDKKNIPLIALAAALTLTVKEDAAVYVAVVALYLIVNSCLHWNKKDLLVGIALLTVSLGWFFAVTEYLANYGDGVMTNRYKNFIYDGSASLITVVKTVLLNPMKALYECADREKLTFIGLTMLPLMGLPLLTRRYERYILLIPYVLVNLMSDYAYQHDIFFQYTYGPTAFLIYLTVVNLAEWKPDSRRMLALITATAVGAACFGMQVIPKAKWYPKKLAMHREEYAAIREELARIPQEAAVTSATFYTTHLSSRDILYDIKYCSEEHLLASEYVVLDPGVTGDFKKYADEDGENGYENLRVVLEEEGYALQSSVNTKLEIYHKESGGA